MRTIGWCRNFQRSPITFRVRRSLCENVGAAAKGAGALLVAAASRMTAGTATFLLDLFIMIYAMFFFFKDGEKILEQIFYYVPLSHEDEQTHAATIQVDYPRNGEGHTRCRDNPGRAGRPRILGRGHWRSRVLGNAHDHPLDCARNWSGPYLSCRP